MTIRQVLSNFYDEHYQTDTIVDIKCNVGDTQILDLLRQEKASYANTIVLDTTGGRFLDIRPVWYRIRRFNGRSVPEKPEKAISLPCASENAIPEHAERSRFFDKEDVGRKLGEKYAFGG